ncbi:MAG: DNA polymerase I [Gemmataceae bacterium]|nr:DNA polymerase I [Gemmataceae bacterium]
MASSGAASAYLIDSHSLIFQVFHAIPEMSSPSGLPTNALFGFTRDMLFLREKKPDYLICAFDLPGPVFRNDLYPDYKAHREAPPDDLISQIPLIYRVLEGLRIPVVSMAGFEADDVLATLAVAGDRRGLNVFVCTSDKDCRQLISDGVRLYSLRKHQEFGRDELLKDWGITPEQVVDFQSLVGDAVDNVPGVPGIGPKTATKLLQEHGTLEKVIEAAARVAASGEKGKKEGSLTPRLAKAIVDFADKLKIGRQLVELRKDVPVKIDWDAWSLQEPDVEALLPMFREFGFRSFADQVRSAALSRVGVAVTVPDDSTPVQGELFPFGANTTHGEPVPVKSNGHAKAGPWQATYRLVDSPKKLDAFEKRLRKQHRIAVDLETTSLEPRRAEIVGLAFCWKEGEGWYLPVRGPEGTALLDPMKTLERLRPLLEDAKVQKVNQNIKYDLMVFRQAGVTLAGIGGDSMVADYLLHAGERSHGMTDLATRYLNHQVIPITDLIGKNGKNQLRMDQVEPAKVAEYSGEDADVAWRLCRIIEPQLEQPGLKKLYDELEVPLIEVLAELEFNGIRLDIAMLERLSREMATQLSGMEEEIHRLAGHEFNIASSKQLREVLFDEMKLPAQRKTGITGESSTDSETLERLAALGHELPRKILEHRQIAKLKGTYVDALPSLMNPATGRVHASFNQTVAATGRLSSSDPNLQNIPVRTEQGRQIRQAFLPEEGWQLLTADYSQIELRLLAHFTGDEALRRAFAEDQDIHAVVAAQVFGVEEKEVTKDMRRMAKTVNFGIIYGMSAFGLAQRLEIPKAEAGKFITAYFARYPKVLDYQQRLLSDCRKNGYVSTILGRRRAISGIRAFTTYTSRNQPEREAINMEIQGSAADLMKLAMLNVYRRLRLRGHSARMLLTVHDELVFEVPPQELKEVATLVEEEMTGAMKLAVPLKVDLGAGKNWLDVEEV